jgi:hypothetical protein
MQKKPFPIDYEELHKRLPSLRAAIAQAVEAKKPSAEDFAAGVRFREDVALRQGVAEVLLASILWIEADRHPHETLDRCVPEIKRLMVYGLNLLGNFLELKIQLQPVELISRGSLVDAWIHLFVEFHAMLGRESDRWLWSQEQVDFVPDDCF